MQPYAVVLAAEPAGRHLLMGDVCDQDGIVRLRTLVITGLEELELIVDGCIARRLDQHDIDETVALGQEGILYA